MLYSLYYEKPATEHFTQMPAADNMSEGMEKWTLLPSDISVKLIWKNSYGQ